MLLSFAVYGMPLVLGLLMGSFANVLIYRVPRGESIVRPGSRCPKCHRKVRPHENIPVLSYIFLRGRCAGCRAKISLIYPVVETLVAVLFLAVSLKFGPWFENWGVVFRDWPFAFLLVAVTFIDLEHRIIPDVMSLGGLAIGLVTGYFFSPLGILDLVFGAVFGFVFFYAVAWGYHRWTGRDGLGGGDIKMIAWLGSYVGIQGVFWTIFLSSIIGALAGAVLALVQRNKKVMQVAIPYGPFLALAALVYYLFGLGSGGEDAWFPFMTPM